jgi:hypothetical protein
LATGFRTGLHAADYVATFGTEITDISTHLAQSAAKAGVAKLQIGRGFAHLGAIEHQLKMLGLNVGAAHLQAVVKGGGITDFGTGRAHLCAMSVGGGMGHKKSPHQRVWFLTAQSVSF